MARRFERMCEAVTGSREYKSEFGSHGYTVPAWVQELVRLRVLKDTSWHNDVSPSFETADGDIRLWVDHRDPAERETGEETPRFRVDLKSEDETVFEGDDAEGAVESILQSDYDEADGTYYARELGGGEPIKKFKTEGEAIRWIAELPRRMSREV